MKRTRMEKGITLVALIITIVVLLILAVVAISSIQNDGILGQAQNAGDKYNQSVKDEQGILGGYLEYLDNNTGGSWTTIYEGNATTDEEGIALLGVSDLFSYGSAGLTYRITVESEEYTGKVETVPIIVDADDEGKMYALFGVENGEAIGVTSMEDLEEKMSNVGENAVLVFGIAAEAEGICAMLFDGATCEYTITKIERKELKGEKIFEGELELTSGTETEIPNLNEEISPARQYAFVFSVNGTKVTLLSVSGDITFLSRKGRTLGVAVGDGVNFMCGSSGSSIYLLQLSSCQVVLEEIYDVGSVDNYLEENGFAALMNDDGTCTLYCTPKSSYVVPETVCGKTVSKVRMEWISGSPIFNKVVEVLLDDAANSFSMITINVADMDFITAVIFNTSVNSFIDLTGCGDELEFTSELLESINNLQTIWYVTEAVKAKYPDNAKIVVK